MHLDTQTTIFMICFVYLMLHGAIWLALQEYRSFQVKLWCVSGIISGVAVVLLAMRGNIPDGVFFYGAQLLMLLGTLGRTVALRLYLLPAPQGRVFRAYYVINAAYFAAFCYLIYFHQNEWAALVLFNGFYSVFCFEYFRIGQKLNQQHASLGARLLMWSGLTFTVSLGIRSLAVASHADIEDIYAPSWDQAIMIFGQFLAITLSNIAFLRIFLEIAERQKIAATHQLAVTSERAEAFRQNSVVLAQLLQEREEIIRQLAMFNKTAGMGALVASLAHELNQPLTAIQLNAELIDSALTSNNAEALTDDTIKGALNDLLQDNQRAATIIKTLRNMFGNGRKLASTFDMNALVNEVLLICKPKLANNDITLVLSLHSDEVTLTGDKSQLQQVLLNLVTNAIEAFAPDTAQPKSIAVRTQLLGGQMVLSVTDNGSGIAPDVAMVIFELLRTNKAEGMGVGLWLSRTIVEAHHGTIEFESCTTSGSSSGSTFTVTLPIQTDELIY